MSSSPRAFRLHIAYEGTLFRGWQEQDSKQEASRSSVSATLRKAIAQATATSDLHFVGSGRTDVGVHAREQVAHVQIRTRLETPTLLKAINAHLPAEIRVLRIVPCTADFHARRDVREKTYRYFILHRREAHGIAWPFLRNWAWFVPQKLDYAVMDETLQIFVGKHDFAAFRNIGTKVRHTVREISSAQLHIYDFTDTEFARFPWMPTANSGLVLLEIAVHGKGFLKQMVRNIAGTIVEVGKGNIPPQKIPQILASKDRTQAGPTAPAHGLFLDRVLY